MFDILLVIGGFVTLLWLGIAIIGSLIAPEDESHLATQAFFIIAFLTVAGFLVRNVTQ